MTCPRCGTAMERDVVVRGVDSVPTGVYGCPECHYVADTCPGSVDGRHAWSRRRDGRECNMCRRREFGDFETHRLPGSPSTP